jgi:hypothetical protein
MSLEKRLITRPSGVVSKNDMGENSTALTSSRNMLRPASRLRRRTYNSRAKAKATTTQLMST